MLCMFLYSILAPRCLLVVWALVKALGTLPADGLMGNSLRKTFNIWHNKHYLIATGNQQNILLKLALRCRCSGP